MAAFGMLLTHTMSNSKDLLVKGIKYLAIALPLMVLGPVILTIGYRAQNDGIYLWLIIGGFIILAAIIMVFVGVKTILNGLFTTNEP